MTPKSGSLLETCGILAIGATFALLTVFLADILPVFPDEPSYTDPSASFHLGKGFTSGAWYAQTANEMFAGNVPLHQMLLVPWLKAFGFSIISVRLICAFYTFVATILVWDFLKRSGLVHSPTLRMCAAAFVLFGETSVSLSLLGRPDALTYLVASFALWLLALPPTAWVYCGLGLAGFVAAWAGLQLLAAFAILSILALIFFRGKLALQIYSLGIGSAAGLVGLFVFYQHFGVWEDFTRSVAPHSASAPRSVYSYTGFFADRTFLLLGLASLLLLIPRVQSGNALVRNAARFSLTAAFILPLGLLALGKFSFHYTWMPSLALVLGCAIGVDRDPSPRMLTSLASFFLLLAVAVGYPRQYIRYMPRQEGRTNIGTHEFISRYIRGDDHVVYATQSYYPVKQIADVAYYQNWYPLIISHAEASEVTALVIPSEQLDELTRRLGGRWERVSERFWFPVKRSIGGDIWQSLAVYRRET